MKKQWIPKRGDKVFFPLSSFPDGSWLEGTATGCPTENNTLVTSKYGNEYSESTKDIRPRTFWNCVKYFFGCLK